MGGDKVMKFMKSLFQWLYSFSILWLMLEYVIPQDTTFKVVWVITLVCLIMWYVFERLDET